MFRLSLCDDCTRETKWTVCPGDCSHKRLGKFTETRHIEDDGVALDLKRETEHTPGRCSLRQRDLLGSFLASDFSVVRATRVERRNEQSRDGARRE